MANKKVKITECCIITNDDKGQRSLVGSAKEALTTLSKNKVDVYVLLEGSDKEAVEAFLKDNNVPFKEVVEKTADNEKYDAVVYGDNNIVVFRSDWQWTIDELVDKLYRRDEKPAHKSEQTKMDEKFADYKHWAEEANKSAAKRREGAVIG